MLLRVYTYFRQDGTCSVNQAALQTAEATGVSYKLVISIKQELKTKGRYTRWEVQTNPTYIAFPSSPHTNKKYPFLSFRHDQSPPYLSNPLDPLPLLKVTSDLGLYQGLYFSPSPSDLGLYQGLYFSPFPLRPSTKIPIQCSPCFSLEMFTQLNLKGLTLTDYTMTLSYSYTIVEPSKTSRPRVHLEPGSPLPSEGVIPVDTKARDETWLEITSLSDWIKSWDWSEGRGELSNYHTRCA
uniref:Uncharacterized protein n=1 Tax=Timema genevievae TaxID=629358 RepID=A0A7R9PQF7_TIMGE|nr:unnamed protein product [Timema genevievae]